MKSIVSRLCSRSSTFYFSWRNNVQLVIKSHGLCFPLCTKIIFDSLLKVGDFVFILCKWHQQVEHHWNSSRAKINLIAFLTWVLCPYHIEVNWIWSDRGEERCKDLYTVDQLVNQLFISHNSSLPRFICKSIYRRPRCLRLEQATIPLWF